VVVRRGRWETVCARGADQALRRGPSTSPLDVTVPRFTLRRIASFAAFAAGWYYIYSRFGEAAGDRFWGAALLLAAVLLMFRKVLPVSLGSFRTTLVGWRRLCVLVPAALLGLVVVLYPHEAACALHFRHRVCP
jgi:hypothetical protein